MRFFFPVGLNSEQDFSHPPVGKEVLLAITITTSTILRTTRVVKHCKQVGPLLSNI